MKKGDFLAHAVMWGDSTVLGFGDERFGMGVYGRTLYNYTAGYNRHGNSDRSPCLSVLVNCFSQSDTTVIDYAEHIAADAERIREPYKGLTQHMAGVVMLSGAISPWQIRVYGGEEKFMSRWNEALEKVADATKAARVEPIFLSDPLPDKNTVFFDGSYPDLCMSREIATMNRKAAEEIGAPYLGFEDAIGGVAARAACMSPDTLHPNALGYTRMTYALVGELNERFDISENMGVFSDILGDPKWNGAPNS